MPDHETTRRLIRLENQVEALRRANLAILEELVELYHNECVSLVSVQRIQSQLASLQSLRIQKNGDRP